MPINKILVVDDVATDRMHLREILSDAGYQVITAASGKEALNLASSDSPDLIFLDIVMDDMDGYQACRKLTTGETTNTIRSKPAPESRRSTSSGPRNRGPEPMSPSLIQPMTLRAKYRSFDR